MSDNNSYSILLDSHIIIAVAKEAIKYLPKGETRDELIKRVLDVRHKLIDLDVYLQDLEWSITEKELNKRENETNEQFFFQGNDLLGNSDPKGSG